MAFDDDISQRLEALAAVAAQHEKTKSPAIRRLLAEGMKFALHYLAPEVPETKPALVPFAKPAKEKE